jgi:RNA polymerase sigma factor (sigma-70 family)
MINLDYKSAMKEPLLTKEEEQSAIKRWQEDKDWSALETLVRSHARIAYSMAYRYTNNPDHMEDLASEGIYGLMKAADKFDSDQGTRFATYSRWWVMTQISQSLAKISTVIDMPSRTYIDAKMGRLESGDIDKAHMAVFGGIDLDAPISDESNHSAMDLLECQRPNPEEEAEINSDEEFQKKMILNALDTLKKRERDVITRRKLKSEPDTLEIIANDLEVTRERVRQIEVKAMTKLKRTLISMGFSTTMLR